MMDNRGFTLVETLVMFVLISLVSIFVINNITGTLSISKNESYKIMKSNIISSANNYLKECSADIIDCDMVWDDNKTSFTAKILENSGYFKNLNSPIDNKYLGDCLIINAIRNNGVYDVSIVDECY